MSDEYSYSFLVEIRPHFNGKKIYQVGEYSLI
jgi:hypothetical protein